ncbi:hypothetical protein [Flavobacterium sp.]|uniref:hypothetical protein n=1 Tax=Flavobacterium sp. TaxID=239 RepID=UPI002632E2A1|nr:hypothetical protein [Flavobacterium sp.]
MKEKQFSEMSDAELLKNKKMMTIMIAVLIGAIVLGLASGTYLAFQGEFTFSNVIPIVMIPMAILQNRNLKEIKKEVERRNLQ